MARSKRKADSSELAIYLRLSSADGTDAESNSIANQRAFLRQWAAREGWQITAEFQDDGHTGTDFDRPGFRALMAALQSGRVTACATTDLSRLGRNYLEVGLLQEKTFPALGVRYIAVNDGYDSARADTGSIDPSLFKNLMNDIYARDCSSKVLRAKRTLQRQGKYRTQRPPPSCGAFTRSFGPGRAAPASPAALRRRASPAPRSKSEWWGGRSPGPGRRLPLRAF